jgi:hypothetical protein
MIRCGEPPERRRWTLQPTATSALRHRSLRRCVVIALRACAPGASKDDAAAVEDPA